MRGFKKKPNAYVYKYVGQRGLVAMPANKSAGIKPGVNLSYPLHTGNKAHKKGMDPDIETQGRHHPKSKAGVSVAPQKGLMSSNFFQ